jgi:antitoxin component YwqK of YwqJK toxin-antitoxin module
MGPYVYHGQWKAHHPNGVTSEVGNYQAGVKNGSWRRWDDQGRLMAEEFWREGRRITPVEI